MAIYGLDDDEEVDIEPDKGDVEETVDEKISTDLGSIMMTQLRDQIASDMWQEYQRYIQLIS